MSSKCPPKCLLIASQPSTFTGRGVQIKSRGLVDTWVEGCISLIRFIQAKYKGFCRGCRHLFSNCCKEKERIRGKEEKKRIEITIGPSIYTLYFLNRSDWPQGRPA
jgi:hypothetical protein